MRIKTQFIITLIVFSLLLIVITSSILVISQQVAKTRAQESLAYSIVQGSSDLTYLSNDYVIYRGSQQLSQWQSRYGSFSQDAANLNVETAEQQALVVDIQANQQRMKTTFDSIVLTLGTSQNQSSNPNQTLSAIQVSWSRISIQTQSVASDGTRLAQLLRSQVDQLNTFNFILILAIVGTFSAFLGVIYVQTFRRTLKSISDLRTGAAVIGSGNLDFKLEESKKDEIGELSSTFNQMTYNLKAITASKKELENEVAERKKAEEQVRQSQKTFYELVERSPFGIYVVDSQFRITHMNISSQNGAFRNVRPLIGRPFNEAMHTLWPDQVAEEIISHFRHTLETGEPYCSPRFTNPRHDVEIVESYEWELQRIRLPDGQHAVICYYFDSSKLRETERALTEAQTELKNYAVNLERLVEERTKELKDAERLAAIGATAGMVGHDIRNPLQAITGDVFLAKTDLIAIPESEEKKCIQESLSEIEKNVDYINKIVADLQDFARPLNPHAEETNLKLLI
jgi:phosphoglycerate-specific signal transduction histidine kinase